MTTRQKIITGVIVLAASFVWAGYATFDQWSSLAVHLMPSL